MAQQVQKEAAKSRSWGWGFCSFHLKKFIVIFFSENDKINKGLCFLSRSYKWPIIADCDEKLF